MSTLPDCYTREGALKELRARRITAVSPLGETVAEILAWLAGGLHNYRAHGDLSAIDWGRPDYIEVRWSGRGLATADWDHLTKLVFLAHDRCVRVEISPRSNQYLTLIFHPRKREGGAWERHPTLAQAVETHRKHHPEEAA